MKPFNRAGTVAADAIIDSSEFRQVMNDHFLHISDNSPDVIEIPMEINVRRRGDFYGLMRELSIEPKLLWITQRINGIEASYDYSGQLTYLRVVNLSIIDNLLQKFRTKAALL